MCFSCSKVTLPGFAGSTMVLAGSSASATPADMTAITASSTIHFIEVPPCLNFVWQNYNGITRVNNKVQQLFCGSPDLDFPRHSCHNRKVISNPMESTN